MSGMNRRGASLLALTLLAAACSGSSNPSNSPTTPSNSPTTPASSSPTSGPTTAQALISSLPSGCNGANPSAAVTVTFVAQGRAWAAAPDGTGLTCLFKVKDPGPFLWGPRADRVLLGGLQVRGVGSDASRPPASLQPSSVSWSRPTGVAVAFVDPNGKKLEKAFVGGSRVEDVTPLESGDRFPSHADITFQEVVYHPSGRAIGFVMTHRIEGSAIWIDINDAVPGGQAGPHRLIWSKEGTVFGPIAFGPDGKSLYYVAALKNGTRFITAADLGTAKLRPGLWKDKQNVLQLVPAPGGDAVALDTGTGCADRKAVLSRLDETSGSALMPSASGPTSVIGWIDDSTVLVGEGECNTPMKLWEVGVGTAPTATLVIEGADQGAVRVSDPTPTPILPKVPVKQEFA
jgi:hypothetical protein